MAPRHRRAYFTAGPGVALTRADVSFGQPVIVTAKRLNGST
jgi:hypothetical protein